MSNDLLLQIQAASEAGDAKRLTRLIERLKRQGLNGQRRPNPPKTLKGALTDEDS